jgi:hypothetical protein
MGGAPARRIQSGSEAVEKVAQVASEAGIVLSGNQIWKQKVA